MEECCVIGGSLKFHEAYWQENNDSRCQFYQQFTSSFLYKAVFHSFSCINILCLLFFLQNDIGAQAAHKMLVKLTLENRNLIWAMARKARTKKKLTPYFLNEISPNITLKMGNRRRFSSLHLITCTEEWTCKNCPNLNLKN